MESKNIFVLLLMATVLGVFGLILSGVGAASGQTDGKRALRDFLTVRRTTGAKYQDRLEAIKRLASNESASKWVALLIGSDDVLSGYDEIAEEHRDAKIEALDPIEAGVLVVLMRALDARLDPAVAFAITSRLDDKRKGRISEIVNLTGPKARISDGVTLPVRQVAKQTLQRVYDADHEYDEAQWRKEIIRSTSQSR
jgi:hypothetical protein